MDKAIIIGVFEFLGLHFCKKLLEAGIEVEGIHIDHHGDDFFLEEKRMEIGRNASFIETALDKWKFSIDEKENAILVVDYYDFFIKKQENEIIENHLFSKLVQELSQTNGKLIFLFPVQFVADKDFEENYARLEIFLNEMKTKGISLLEVYLPSIYGPWQPKEMAFQQHFLSLTSLDEQWTVSDREWTQDTLYVEDVVEMILQSIHDKRGKYFLMSEETEKWAKCCEYLSIPAKKQCRRSIRKEFYVLEKTIRQTISFQTRLEEQKRHLETLLNIKRLL